MNNLTLVVKKRQSYGRDLIYPACDHARLFCELLGCKTFTPDQIRLMKRLKIEFLIDPNESQI